MIVKKVLYIEIFDFRNYEFRWGLVVKKSQNARLKLLQL